MADGVDCDVDAAASGQLLGDVARILLGQVHGHRSELLGDRQALLDRVDREHRPGAGGDRRLHRAQADRAEPEHRDAVARADLAVGDRVISGTHHVAGEQGDLVADAFGDPAQRQVRVGHERLLGLRSLERTERRTVAERALVVALVVGAAQALKKHVPQAVWKHPSTRSPSDTRVTPSPAASTVPTNSWPSVNPGSMRDTAVVDV